LFLNLYPQFIYNFSPRIQRAISILIFDTYSTEASYMTVGSDLWHQRLTEIGYERWTSSPRTFLIGTGIKPWDARILRETSPTRLFEGQLNGAADTGGYESGLWGILAPAGLVGLLLYVSVIGYFVIPNALRLYRGKLHGIQLTIIFLGTYPALEWALFCFRAGGYPAIELLLATTAFYYMHDHNSRELEAPADVAVDDGSTYAGARDSWA
ncbi:MAG: hypothetical protein ACREKL_02020, partial [Chthoniobacterales bacterium]